MLLAGGVCLCTLGYAPQSGALKVLESWNLLDSPTSLDWFKETMHFPIKNADFLYIVPYTIPDIPGSQVKNACAGGESCHHAPGSVDAASF